jgi:membrane fusion protein (multidrug efflux system)
MLQKMSPARLAWGLITVVTLQACSRADQTPAAAPPPEVAIATVAKGAVPLDLSYTGQTVGSREVEVRARVTGIVLKRSYREGAVVRQGEVLFQIDPAPFEASVAQSKAALAVAKANAAQARRDHDRVLPLFQQGLVSVKDRDDAVSKLEVAEANAQSAAAALRTAELQLGYTSVRAPISGVASRESRSEGSLVSADTDSALLTRIVQIEPLYVDFSVPSNEATLLRARMASGKQNVKVKVTNDEGVNDTAVLTFIDNAVDIASGTVQMRAVLANAQRGTWPGQFVRAEVEDMTVPDAIAIPRRAVLSSTQGYMVWSLDDKNSAQPRPVKLGRNLGNNVLITEGLTGGERIIVDGLFKVTPGAIVRTVPAAGQG